jgi:hypothetical protein
LLGPALIWSIKQPAADNDGGDRPPTTVRLPSPSLATAPAVALGYRDPRTEGAGVVIIFQVRFESPVKVSFMEDDHPVQAFAANEADQSFHVGRLPW